MIQSKYLLSHTVVFLAASFSVSVHAENEYDEFSHSLIPIAEPEITSVESRPNNQAIITKSGTLTDNAETANGYATNCLVDFSDWDALHIIPDYAQNTFAKSPFYIQKCGYDKQAYVKPTVHNHHHLSFEDPDMNTCQIQKSCPEHDPRDQPRTLSTHTRQEKLSLTLYGSNGSLPFGIKTIRITGNKQVKLCYKQHKKLDFDLVQRAANANVRYQWGCWKELSGGLWDVSNWVNNVWEVTVYGNGGSGTFGVDDIVYRIY